MERLSFTVPKGTTAAIERKALQKKVVKQNGKPNVSEYIRKLLEKHTGVKHENTL